MEFSQVKFICWLINYDFVSRFPEIEIYKGGTLLVVKKMRCTAP